MTRISLKRKEGLRWRYRFTLLSIVWICGRRAAGIGPALLGAGGMMNAFDVEGAGMKDGGVCRMLVRFGLSESAAQRYNSEAARPFFGRKIR